MASVISLKSSSTIWLARLVWDAKQDYGNNITTSISVSYQVMRADSTGTVVSSTMDGGSCYLTYNGVSYGGSHSSRGVSSNTWVTINSWSFKGVEHDSTGNASIKLEFAGSLNRNGERIATFWLDSLTVALPKIPKPVYITSAPDFTELDFDKGLTIKFVNSNNATTNIQACISLTGAKDDIPYRYVGSSGGSYTFNLTPAERTTLINAVTTGDNVKVRFYVKGIFSGSTYWSYATRTFTLADALPELYPTVEDVNPITLDLTGNPEKVVRLASHTKCIANPVAKQGATVKLCEIENGPQKESTGETVLINPESAVTKFTATDSRGLVGVKEVVSPFVDYFKPTVNHKITLDLVPNQSQMKVSFELTGQWFSGNFGVKNNDFTLWIRQAQGNKVDAAEWGEITILSEVSRGENTYKATFSSNSFDYDKTYTFQFKIIDSLYSVESEPYTVKLYPVFDWSETDFNFNVPVTFQKGFSFGKDNLEDYVIETGTDKMGSNGTWYWSKWKSGKAECYGVRNYGAMAVTEKWGVLFRSAIFEQDLPSGLFATAPEVIEVTFRDANFGAWIAKHEQAQPSTSSTGSFIVVRPASATLERSNISFNIVGRWLEPEEQ